MAWRFAPSAWQRSNSFKGRCLERGFQNQKRNPSKGYRGFIGGYKGYVGLGDLEFRVLSFYLLTSRIMLKVMMMLMMMIKEQLSRPSSLNGSFPSLYIP